MEAIFFIARTEEALGLRSSHDLPVEPAAEPLPLESPDLIVLLASLLLPGARAVRPLRDATCQSFPVWDFEPALSDRIAALPDDEIERLAERVSRELEKQAPGCDRGELEMLLEPCLQDLRQALRERGPHQRLFVLLEEKAW